MAERMAPEDAMTLAHHIGPAVRSAYNAGVLTGMMAARQATQKVVDTLKEAGHPEITYASSEGVVSALDVMIAELEEEPPYASSS